MENKEYLSRLNEKQKEAVTSNAGSVLVIAGAGSGKTAVLISRIIYLVLELGISFKRVLAFTFTNKAANEMKTRLVNSFHNASFPWIGTFHSFCLRVLREDIDKLGWTNGFTIVDEDDQLSIVREMYTKFGLDKSFISYQNCLNYIMTLKANEVDPENAINELLEYIEVDSYNKKKEIISVAYAGYQKYLGENNLLDFEDLIKYTKKLFSIRSDILEKWKNRFDYVLVDEFQDTNNDQFEIVKMLAKDKKNVFAVGDPDQMIYSWRGAHEMIFDDFKEYFEDVKIIILDRNYRSTKFILDTANKLISYNTNRIKKNLYTEDLGGNNVVFHNAANQDRESRWVVNKINYLIENYKYKYSDFAILYRSNYLSRNIEQELIRSHLPYFVFGGFKFYQRKEIKDVIAYLRLISNNDDISLLRICNVPKRQISETTLTKIKEYAYNKNIPLFDAMLEVDKIDSIADKTKKAVVNFCNLITELRNKKFNSLTNMLDKVLEDTGYLQMLKDGEESNRIENITELKNALSQYEFKNPNSGLIEYLQDIALYTSSDEEAKKTNNAINLMTVHSAKGLEFKNVFIIEFNEGIFPSKKSIDADWIDEERRIAYVAMTRARENLFILSSDGISFFGGDRSPKSPSRFFEEIKNSKLTIESEKYRSISDKDVDWFDSSKAINFEENYHTKEQEFNIGDTVVHTEFGSGVVLAVTNVTIDVAFKYPYGTKTIMKNHKSIVRKLS